MHPDREIPSRQVEALSSCLRPWRRLIRRRRILERVIAGVAGGIVVAVILRLLGMPTMVWAVAPLVAGAAGLTCRRPTLVETADLADEQANLGQLLGSAARLASNSEREEPFREALLSLALNQSRQTSPSLPPVGWRRNAAVTAIILAAAGGIAVELAGRAPRDQNRYVSHDTLIAAAPDAAANPTRRERTLTNRMSINPPETGANQTGERSRTSPGGATPPDNDAGTSSATGRHIGDDAATPGAGGAADRSAEPLKTRTTDTNYPAFQNPSKAETVDPNPLHGGSAGSISGERSAPDDRSESLAEQGGGGAADARSRALPAPGKGVSHRNDPTAAPRVLPAYRDLVAQFFSAAGN